MRQHDERDLRTALRGEADRHRPDRAAMLDRIAEGRAATARRPVHRSLASLLRPAAAALAVAVVLVLAVAGVRLSNRGPEVDGRPVAAQSLAPATPAPTVAATTPAPAPATAATSPPAAKPSRSPAGTPSRSPSSSPPPRTDHDGYLSSSGMIGPNSNKSWTQDTVLVTSTRKLTALDVTVQVTLTPGVVESGRFSTVPANLLTVTTSRTAEKLVFRFRLRQGATLAPGEYTFAAQFHHHATNRTTADDSYVAQVHGDAEAATVSGGFMLRR